jgi:hypothetical protein
MRSQSSFFKRFPVSEHEDLIAVCSFRNYLLDQSIDVRGFLRLDKFVRLATS